MVLANGAPFLEATTVCGGYAGKISAHTAPNGGYLMRFLDDPGPIKSLLSFEYASGLRLGSPGFSVSANPRR